MINETIKKIFVSSVEGNVRFNRPLRDCTSFRIGGPASLLVEPSDLGNLKNALLLCNRFRLPIFLLGNGTNLLVDDRGIKKVVIRLNSPFFKTIGFRDNRVVCGSGASLFGLVESSIKRGLGGFEFLAGIPGSVGGAVAMNAGSATEAIGRYVEWVRVIDYKGRLKDLKKREIKFGYRRSNLSSNKIVLQVCFKLKKSDPSALKERFNKFLQRKIQTQDLDYPNAGCIFKNPATSKWTTGRLLESAGFKGIRIGDAQFSKIHANFIVNLGRASFRDVINLMKLAQKEIKNKHNLWLEPEIKIIS